MDPIYICSNVFVPIHVSIKHVDPIYVLTYLNTQILFRFLLKSFKDTDAIYFSCKHIDPICALISSNT